MQADREELQYTFNLLQQFRGNVLFLDTRPNGEFLDLHVEGAVNVPLEVDPPEVTIALIESLLHSSPSAALFHRRKRMCVIVAGSEATCAITTALYAALLRDKCKEIHMLQASVEWFFERYLFLGEGRRAVPHAVCRVGYPNEIIPDRLFLGSHLHAESREVVEHLGITHIVNATKSVANRFQDRIQYCRVFVEDTETEMISYHFNKAFRFLDVAMGEVDESRQTRILVHCAQGISRSATLVIMYLMRRNDLTYEQALTYVKKHRDVIQPNPGFEAQLREFERTRFSFRRSSTKPSAQPNSPPPSCPTP